MFSYTIEEVVAARETRPELACPHCKTAGKVEIVLLRTQIFMAFIPMLARISGGQATCGHCGLPIKIDAESGALRQAYREFRRRTRTPFRFQIGMFGVLMALVIGFFYITYQAAHNPWNQKIDPAILAAPQTGDLYEVGIEQFENSQLQKLGYTVARVEKVEDKLVTLRYRENPIPEPADGQPPLLDELLEKPGDFGDKIVKVSRNALRSKDLRLPANDPNGHSLSIGHIYAAKRP